MIEELIKNFKVFCEMCEGKYVEDISPECRKFSFRIIFDFVEAKEKLEHLSLKVTSDEGDEEIFTIKDVRILNVERYSENDDKGELSYYVLNIVTDKGELKLKKNIKEDKLLISFKSNNLEYSSTIIF